MYTIGEFALIAEVSTKTLRYYDDIDLFKPCRIDNFTNYRYYNKEQISEIMFIKELKKYDLSLVEIKKIKESHNKKLLDGILEKQLSNIDRKIEELKNMKKSIENKINDSVLWTNNDDKLNYVIDKINLEKRNVIFVREKIKLADIGQLIGKLYELISKFSLEIRDSHMIVIHNREENELADVEVFAAIEKTEFINETFIKDFEGGEFLKTKHNAIKNKGIAYANLYDFAKENNYKVLEPAIEKYKMENGKFVVDIMFRIKENYSKK